jgi:hypothetical protein
VRLKRCRAIATMVQLFHRKLDMKVLSKNAISADNRQERLEIESWIVGFTDGEGCFSVSFIKNKTTKNGWQIFPEFVITQGVKSLPTLKEIETFFKCGKIFINKRYDNHNEHLYRYCVRSIGDLEDLIIPFFKRYPLKTYKQKDFKLFTRVVRMMSKKQHLTIYGARRIAGIVEQMNRKKPSRFLKSQETKR